MERSKNVLSIRPHIPGISEDNTLPLESFQNNTLRPILKLQNSLVISLIRSQIGKTDIPNVEVERRKWFQHRIQRDLNLRNVLIGMVVGLFTEEELLFYLSHKTEFSKRIIQMLSERISNQWS